MPVEHLSYSSISTYLMCARSWRFRYIDKPDVPTASALVFGSAFHNTVEDYVAARALGSELDLIPLWHEKWTKQLEKDSEIDWGKDTPEKCLNDGIRILSSEEVLSTINDIVPMMGDDGALENVPIVEKRVELRVPGVSVPVIGYIDVITADGVPCDIKTSSRSWSPDKAYAEMQPLFYLAALIQMGMRLPNLAFRHYVFTKTKEPKAQVIETQREADELFWLFGMIQEVWNAINAGAFPPNPTSWKCSDKWCECWSICRGKSLA